MKKKRLLLELHMKSAWKLFPMMLLGTLVMTLILGISLYMMVNYEIHREDVGKYEVALVVEDDNIYTHMAISYLYGEKMVSDFCHIEEMTSEEAAVSLKDGSVSAVVYVPEGFMQGVLEGNNIPARIILEHAGIGSKSGQFRSMISAAALDLGLTQAAIYAVDDLCVKYGKLEAIQESENYLNQELFRFFMGRSKVLKKVSVSATGDLSIPVFYSAVFLVMLLFFQMMLMGRFFITENSMFRRILINQKNMGIVFLNVSQWASITVMYCILFAVVYIACTFDGIVVLRLGAFVKMAVAIGCVVAIGQLVAHLAKDTVTMALTLFFYGLADLFVAGNLVPQVFLPALINRLGAFCPTRYIVSCMGSGIAGNGQWISVMMTLVIGVIFFCATNVADYYKNQME